MTDEEFDELKRVCRIRGVPEPTEKPEPLQVFFFSANVDTERDKAEMRRLARACLRQRVQDGEPAGVAGAGFLVPDGFMLAAGGVTEE